ncbi:EAL domain-containing protein [Marinomonas algarum]|uniref:EAL domain-containing protein n=1 Tax=Marinomonas algarum TaxID=2883105 RepID=A0A9X1IKE3_9GAMM|nr:EAL domain-containing protein [Marinomonas algarum]MCB5160890.1 EAL domain-containing protein [Marinomonas algarum]
MKNIELKSYYAFIVSVVSFVIILSLGVSWAQSNHQAMVRQQEFLLSSISRTQASILERRLSAAFTSAQILAYEVEQKQGETGWFDIYAEKLIESIGGIESLQLAPNGIISNIYPLEGNEAAQGLDIITGPAFKKEASLSIKNRSMFIIGPVALVQGGVAVVSRTPVFLNRDTDQERFWGFASAVVYLDNLLNATQLRQLENEDYQFKLTRKHAATREEITLSSSSRPLAKVSASTSLMLPVGTWTLSISQQSNTDLPLGQLRGMGILLSVLIALLLSISLYAILIQPLKLRTQVKNKTAELQELAYKDPLTGLKNRRFLQDSLAGILDNNKKRKRMSAFIYFDLDNFKRINDTIGHDVGDQILIIVGKRLNAIKGPLDLVVRLGGDEFGILLGDITNPEQASDHAIKILNSVREPACLDQKKYSLSTSLGIAMIPEHGSDLVTIMQNADMALYQAKLSGKNQYAFYTEAMKIDTHALIEAENDLVLALERNEFEVYFQPQFNLHTDEIFAAEALVRWNHPEKGLVFPNDFIPIAESTGKIVDLGYWVLENSIAYLAQRKKEKRPDITLHINLAAAQLADPHFVSLVENLLEKYQVPAHLVGFEVTETSILKDVVLAKKMLQCLQDMGVCISIDDFGTGYSSLSQLKNLPVNMLKIDRSFVTDLEHNPDDSKIVEAIIAMAHKLNVKVLAEGIETRAQWRTLEAFQCDFGQGYYVSKPIPAKEFNLGKPLIHSDP